jgi:hypothetical protein
MATIFDEANKAAAASGGNFIHTETQLLTSVGVGIAPDSLNGVNCYDAEGGLNYYPFVRITVNVEQHSPYFTSYYIVTVAHPSTTYTLTIDEDNTGDEVYSATTTTYSGTEAQTDEEKILYGLKQVYAAGGFSGCSFTIVSLPGFPYRLLKVVAPSACVKIAKSQSGGSGIWTGYGDCSSAGVIIIAKPRDNTYETFWGTFIATATYSDNLVLPLTDLRGIEKLWAIATAQTIKSIYTGLTPMVMVNFTFLTRT